MLGENGKCSTPPDFTPHLLFAHERAVLSMDTTGRAVKLIANTTGAAGLDFHYKKNLLFWSDTKTRKVNLIFFQYTYIFIIF